MLVQQEQGNFKKQLLFLVVNHRHKNHCKLSLKNILIRAIKIKSHHKIEAWMNSKIVAHCQMHRIQLTRVSNYIQVLKILMLLRQQVKINNNSLLRHKFSGKCQVMQLSKVDMVCSEDKNCQNRKKERERTEKLPSYFHFCITDRFCSSQPAIEIIQSQNLLFHI